MCCVCSGTCSHIGPHAYCYEHSPSNSRNVFTTYDFGTMEQSHYITAMHTYGKNFYFSCRCGELLSTGDYSQISYVWSKHLKRY